MLEEMFERQLNLARNFIPIDDIRAGRVDSETWQQYLLTYISLLQEEAVELQRELPARKFWRPSIQNQEVITSNLRSELADLWHILIAITLISGLDAEEMLDIYREKNEINLKRVKDKS